MISKNTCVFYISKGLRILKFLLTQSAEPLITASAFQALLDIICLMRILDAHMLFMRLGSRFTYSQEPNKSNVIFIFFHPKSTPLQAYSGVIFIIFPEFGPPLFSPLL